MTVTTLAATETAAQRHFAPRRLGHVNLVVSDVDRSMEFYKSVVGIEEAYVQPKVRAGFLSNGNTHHDIGMVEASGPLAEPARQSDRIALGELAAALDRLPDDQRQVLLLVALEGLSYRDTADIMGVPIGTVMSRLARGRERLRQTLAGESTPPLRRVK